MNRSSWGVALVILSILAAPLASLIMTPTAASASTAAPKAVLDDEIIVIRNVGSSSCNGRVQVDDPYTPPGIKKVQWDSGNDLGYFGVAAGDVNGDGAAEIVATGYCNGVRKLVVFDPKVTSGSPVMFESDLPGDRNWLLVATGDFDGDGRAEIAATHDEPNQAWEILNIFDLGVNGAWTSSQPFTTDTHWQGMATGDVNGDGYSDLTFLRDHYSDLTSRSGRDWGVIADRPQYNAGWTWAAVAAGRMVNNQYPGAQLALTRGGVGTSLPSMIFFLILNSTYQDLVYNGQFVYNPPFLSVGLGDFNGDGLDETAALRDPGFFGGTSLIVVNNSGTPMRAFQQAVGYGSTAYSLVRCGDLNGDGKDEIVIIRSDSYRIYTRPAIDDSYTDVLQSMNVKPIGYQTPSIAIANVDGAGITTGPTLQVDPPTLTFNLPYAGTSPVQGVSITNVGAPGSLPWQASVTAGSSFLRLDKTSGGTPDGLGVSVNTTGVPPGTYFGTISISAATATNPPQTVSVSLTLTDPGFIALPSQVSMMQQIGGTPIVRKVLISRLNSAVPWVATAVPMSSAASALDAIAKGRGHVGAQGLSIDGVNVPPPSWLSFTPDSGSTPATMSISAVGTTPGKYAALILIVAQDPNVANRVVTVDVSAVIAVQIYKDYVPLVVK